MAGLPLTLVARYKSIRLYNAYLRNHFPRVFEDRRCIFVHIPKAAGSNITNAIFGRGVGHRKYIDYLKADRDKTRSFFSFSITRNPWDRLVSGYFYLLRGGMEHKAYDRAFSRFLNSRYPEFEPFVMNWLEEPVIHNTIHFQPQYKYLVDEKNELALDHIGKLENLEEEFSMVIQKLNIDNARLGVNVNASLHGDYRSYYTEKMIDKVNQIYKKDIQLFNYSF